LGSPEDQSGTAGRPTLLHHRRGLFQATEKDHEQYHLARRSGGHRHSDIELLRPAISATSAMSIDPPSPKRTMRKRRGLSAEEQNDGKEVIVPFPPEDRRFRVWFLSSETGISADQASELVDRIEANGAALFNAARRMKIHSR